MCVRPMKKEALAGWAVGVGSVEHRGEHAVVCEYATFFFSFPDRPRNAGTRKDQARAARVGFFSTHPSMHGHQDPAP